MNKKFIVIIALLGLLGGLTWFALDLNSHSAASDQTSFDFKIEDTTTVDKLAITDAFGQHIELIKGKHGWTDLNGNCVAKANISLILEALHSVEFKAYLPEKSIQRFTELMASSTTKVEIYQDGEWTKTWYIGPTTPDHLGQIMLLESADDGKSKAPVMMKLAGVNGVIDPRFFADPRKWACTEIFALDMEEIELVRARFQNEPFRNFELKSRNGRYTLTQNGKALPSLDTTNVFRYLQGFQKVHFEQKNFTLSDKQVDSVKRSSPFCVFEVKSKNDAYKLRFFRIPSKEEQRNEFGNLVNMDMNSFWCQLPDGELVRCQYFVFNPLILAHVFFPAMEAKFPENLRSGI
ncbi:MAG: hypothetical protein RLZZ301_622 [Bacteroidota bacterium]|jgi:hypothetical protein